MYLKLNQAVLNIVFNVLKEKNTLIYFLLTLPTTMNDGINEQNCHFTETVMRAERKLKF